LSTPAAAALPRAISSIFSEMSMAVICFTCGACLIAVDPVPQPNSSSSISGRSNARVTCSLCW
jgi:hypothetical protein